jgi:hypothetical protein
MGLRPNNTTTGLRAQHYSQMGLRPETIYIGLKAQYYSNLTKWAWVLGFGL